MSSKRLSTKSLLDLIDLFERSRQSTTLGHCPQLSCQLITNVIQDSHEARHRIGSDHR